MVDRNSKPDAPNEEVEVAPPLQRSGLSALAEHPPALQQPVELKDEELLPTVARSKGIRLDPTTLLSAGNRRVDFARLESLTGQSILSANQFDRDMVVELCKFAALLEVTEIASHHPLDGKLVITAFFEASTRTRLSFESATQRLAGRVVSVPDGKVTGIAKGESLADIGEMFNSYGDLVVLRHPQTGCVEQIQENLQLPLINAGNGSGEHPTQALLDWYALLKWRPQFIRPTCPKSERVHVGIVGTPGSMRAVKSFLMLALGFAPHIAKVTVVSEMRDPLGPALASRVANSPVELEITGDLQSVLPDLDVIYMNSIAFLGDSYRELDSGFQVTGSSPLKPGAVIMHPLARRGELDTSLDNTSHNLYFAQAAGAVFMRQALLIAVLGRIPNLPPSVLLLTT